MTRSVRTLLVAVLACLALAGTTAAQSGNVQVTAADAKVFLSADATSAVVTAVPIGATLEVVTSANGWFQVRLPKDASGFDRMGFIQAAKVKTLTPAGGATPAPTAPAAPAAPPATAPATGRAASGAPSTRPTAAVLEFEYGTIERWWSGTWNIGKGISDMMVDELLSTGQVRLIERKRIETVLAEQNLSNSQRADPSAKEVAALGKVLGARVLVTGSITKFGSEERYVGGAAGSVAGRFLGGTTAKNTTAIVAITVRAIDSSTSEILASTKAEAKSSRKGLLLGAGVAGNAGAIDMGSKNFRESILGEATERAVKLAATQLAAQMANSVR